MAFFYFKACQWHSWYLRLITNQLTEFINKLSTGFRIKTPLQKLSFIMKKSKKVCNLDTCSLCRFCMSQWLPAVAANRENYVFEKNELLFKEGDPVQGIYYVHSGTVKVHKHWGEDKELIVRFAGKGDIVGHRGLGTELVFPVSATALETSVICFLPIDFFKAGLAVNQDYLYRLTMFFADELKESEKKMRDLAHMSVKGRIWNALIFLEQKFGLDDDGFIKIILSRQDLASFTGTTYETVFRVLQDFVNDKHVGLSGKKIKIFSKDLKNVD